MEHNKCVFIKMRLIINIVAFITFIAQLLSFALNALTFKKPESFKEELYIFFIFYAFLCSLMTIVFFFVQYNCNVEILKKKVVKCLSLVIVLPSVSICMGQIFVLHDFILTSCILLTFNIYIIRCSFEGKRRRNDSF